MTVTRTRRFRSTEALRRLTRETRLSADGLVYPLFIREGKGIEEPLPSMEGQTRYSPDTVAKAIEQALAGGIHSFLLFGLPESKDDHGSGAWAENGVIQQTLRRLKAAYSDTIVLIADLCLCEYTSHGHCGLIKDDQIDNDSTLPLLAQTAIAQVQAGADIVAPSGMMDQTVITLRQALDADGYTQSAILSYAAKHASAFYGPFRDAAGSAPRFGNRESYQMDYHNQREAMYRIESEINQGADAVIIKPALPCLDIISLAAAGFSVPIAAYSVSGEYAMIRAASKAGLIDESRVICESAVAVFRAGADILITYFAKELADAIGQGVIG
jgi:porphobilinogen synthase